MPKKIISINQLQTEFKDILASFDGFPAVQAAICRGEKIGEFIGQAKFMTINETDKLEINITEGNHIAEVRLLTKKEKKMSTQTFIDNLKSMDDWDEQDYQAWKTSNNPTGTELDSIRDYLKAKGANPTQDDVDEFTEDHADEGSPTNPTIQIIIYQWWLLYKQFVYGCQYS